MAVGIGRRDFIAALGSAAVWPLAARAQQPALPVVGYLSSGSPAAYAELLKSFRDGLGETGFVEGRNVTIEYRWADGQFDRLPVLAADLAQRRSAVIVTSGIGSALVAKTAAPSIPLVFLSGDDPVKFGLAASLNRPGGNATGVAWLTSVLVAKRLELVRELVPVSGTVAVLVNPLSPESAPQRQEVQEAARTLGQPIEILEASDARELDSAFATFDVRPARALIVTTDPFLYSQRDQIVSLAARHAVPAVYDRREYVAAGGLICYGTHFPDAYRQLGIYTAKILKGEKPADLPIMQPTKFEMVINLKTAKSLGLAVPLTLQVAADEVIE
jgi:putative ABC transport system substrate-binding protein